MKTSYGQLIINMKSAPTFTTNNMRPLIADGTDVIKMMIEHAITTEKSLKHMKAGLLTPGRPQNAVVPAYVVLRLYLSDGIDNKKELKKM